MAKILFTCFGSFGDLYPYIILAKTLKNRGHTVTIGSTTLYQEQIKKEGILFTHLRSSIDCYTSPETIRAFVDRIFDPVKGGEYITQQMMSTIDETYQDSLDAVKDNDIVISHPLAYTTPIVCRDQNVPWLSTSLAPMFFLSTYDPPTLSAAPWLKKIHTLSPGLYRGLFSLLKKATKPWCKPLYQLCQNQQISPPNGHPLFEGQYSPYGTLAMFSPSFAAPQSDWPINTTMTGFPLFSAESAQSDELTQLQTFIDAGEPPIVFALGSSAVHVAKDFYKTSAQITRQLKRRAVLVCGDQDDQIKDIKQGDDIFCIGYVAYEKLFPQACLIVHQGGIGTLAQSLVAQRPLLIVPFGFDQFDNGERVKKLGIGNYIKRQDYTVEQVTPIIRELLNNKCYQTAATSIGKVIQLEEGANKASNVIEALLKNHTC